MHKATSSNATKVKGSQSQASSSSGQHAMNDLAVAGAKLYALISQVTGLVNETLDQGKGKAKEEDLMDQLQLCTRTLQSSTSLVPLLAAVSSDSVEEEPKRVSGKVDRALERLRRAVMTWTNRSLGTGNQPVANAVQLLVAISGILEATLSQALVPNAKPHILNFLSDLTTRALDSLFMLAKLTLKVHDPQTHVPTYERLSNAGTILSNVSSSGIPLANYLRCLSGAHYNFAGSLYQAGRHGQAIPFLKDACVIGGKALVCRSREKIDREEENREQEGWKQLEETLFRRWELIGICYVKTGDRKNAYTAFLQSIATFPYQIYDFLKESGKMPPSSLFGSTANDQFKQLAAIVDRVTYIGLSELLLPAKQVSLRHSLDKAVPAGAVHDPRIIGILMERQIDSLEQRCCKEPIQQSAMLLLEALLKVYDGDSKMPIRRARVLLRLLENLYRANDVPAFETIQSWTQEIENLLLAQDLGADLELTHYRIQYRALGHLWLALHAHRSAVDGQVAFFADHIEHVCQILRSAMAKPPVISPRMAAKKSLTPQPPPTKPTTRRRPPTGVTPAAMRAPTATRKVTSVARKKDPVALNPKRAALQPVSLNITTPPRGKARVSRHVMVFDNFERLSGVLQTATRILGLLSLSLPKVQLLDIWRKLAEAHGGPNSEDYISASLDLAHEYVKIGKTRRATSIFNQALECVRGGHVSDETCAVFLLRFAESLALVENVTRSASVYCEAMAVSQRIGHDEKDGTTVQRVHARVKRLERAALAARTVAIVQHCKEEQTLSIDLLLQSLRLWNRAMDNLMRLNPQPSKPSPEVNPFDMSDLKQALPSEAAPLPDPTPQTTVPPQRHLDSLGLRISEGLFAVLFDLAQAYLARGSAKEAEFFVNQARELAEALNAPAMLSRALAKHGEVQIRQGLMQEGYGTLVKAGELLKDVPTIDSAEVHRLCADYNARRQREEDAQELYRKSVGLLEEIDAAFQQHEGIVFGSRKSFGLSPTSGKAIKDVIMPDILTTVLRQQIWLLRDQNDDQFDKLLEQFLSLPRSTFAKAEESSLLAKLNLHNVYLRFQSDMFLNSLAESPIAVPMGMHKTQGPGSVSAQDILNALDQAEEHFWSSLTLVAQRGSVLDVRESAIALAVIKSFQTSLGRKDDRVHIMMSRLLDASAALTLRREMLEAIHHKFPRSPGVDDMQWPLITAEGNILPSLTSANLLPRKHVSTPVDPEDEDDEELLDLEAKSPMKAYWDSVRLRYRSYFLNPSALSTSQVEKLPSNWIVVHISLTEDKNTLFISRQEGGSDPDSLVFSVPLKSRRDDGSGDDEGEYLSFDHAMEELREIVRLSDEGTKAAIHIKSDDDEARAAWWKQRGELDLRLKNLLENIEFCWFGAFKTILSPKNKSSPEVIAELRTQFENVFERSFGIQVRARTGNRRKTTSQSRTQSFNQVRLDDSLLRCFSTLSPKCRDEELEDLIYFILDLYQFHGVAIPISEIDIAQAIVDIRTVLEEYSARVRGPKRTKQQAGVGQLDDEHMFLVLDKNLQGLPWESVPILRGRSVSRVPSVDFLIDRLEYSRVRRSGQPEQPSIGAVVDPRRGCFILNPSGDLSRTEGRFRDWADGMKKAGWDGIIGKPMSEQQFENALRQSDLVVYFGHGGGEQYLRSYKIRRLKSCAATMLWGCSSGALREMGDFDRTGTANAYMLGGCPTLVANLWDVTDRDIDKFCQATFDKIKLTPEYVQNWRGPVDTGVSVIAAVAQARSACKLKYLTGAAPVVYGIPFYL